MRLKHVPIVVFSGCLWFFIGIMLMTKGINAAIQGSLFPSSTVFMPFLTKHLGDSTQSALSIIVSGLFLGFLKGRFVLSKSAKRVVERLLVIPEPVPIKQVYSLKYSLIILGMVGLGMSMRWLSPPLDIKAWVDTIIGSALMNGSLFYFRFAFMLQKQKA